jgi:hypothetical protein
VDAQRVEGADPTFSFRSASETGFLEMIGADPETGDVDMMEIGCDWVS